MSCIYMLQETIITIITMHGLLQREQCHEAVPFPEQTPIDRAWGGGGVHDVSGFGRVRLSVSFSWLTCRTPKRTTLSSHGMRSDKGPEGIYAEVICRVGMPWNLTVPVLAPALPVYGDAVEI